MERGKAFSRAFHCFGAGLVFFRIQSQERFCPFASLCVTVPKIVPLIILCLLSCLLSKKLSLLLSSVAMKAALLCVPSHHCQLQANPWRCLATLGSLDTAFTATAVMSDSVRPHRQQPTRLPGPWDSPGKNTGVGCHFLLHCMKVKSQSEVTQLCPTGSDPKDCSLPGSSIHGIF